MTGRDEGQPVHLIGFYRHCRRDFTLVLVRVTWRYPWEKWFRTVPVPACRSWNGKGRKIPDSQMVSIYEDPSLEAQITCDKCLAWLTRLKNRQMVTPGGVEEYIREVYGVRPVAEPEGSLLARQVFPGNEERYERDRDRGGSDDGTGQP